MGDGRNWDNEGFGVEVGRRHVGCRDWRGGFRVGAGVPTPWGSANIYSATSYAQSRVKNIGSMQWWLN